MNKKVIKGLIWLLVGVIFAITGLSFLQQSYGTALLYASSRFGLYYKIYPVILLLAIIFCIVGLRKIKKNFEKKEKPVKAAGSSVSFVFCGSCGGRNNANDKFCSVCGKAL